MRLENAVGCIRWKTFKVKLNFFKKEVHSLRSHLLFLNRKWHDRCFGLEQCIYNM